MVALLINWVALAVVAFWGLAVDEASLFAGHDSPDIPFTHLLGMVAFFAVIMKLASALPLRALPLPWNLVFVSAVTAQVVAVLTTWFLTSFSLDFSDEAVVRWLTIHITVAVFLGLVFGEQMNRKEAVITLGLAVATTWMMVQMFEGGAVGAVFGYLMPWTLLPGIARAWRSLRMANP